MATTELETKRDMIAGLYAASFDRAPDQEGLNGWIALAEAKEAEGKSPIEVYEAIMDGFTANKVFSDLYDHLTDAKFVEEIYVNVLGQAGDAGGITAWKNLLEAGTSRGDMVVKFVNATLTFSDHVNDLNLTNEDREIAFEREDYLQNKVDVALQFVDTLGELTNVADPSNPLEDPAYIASQHVLKEVNENEQTTRHMESVINLASEQDDPLQFIIDHVKSAMNERPIELTHMQDDEDIANPDTDNFDDNLTADDGELSNNHDELEHEAGKLTNADNVINAPVYVNGTSKKNTLDGGTDTTGGDNIDRIIDPSNEDADTLEAFLIDDLGIAQTLNGTAADILANGPIITDIENITLHATQDVNVYSLENVTSTAEDDLTTEDVNEGATISVNVDHGGTEKFISSTDIDLSTVIANVDGNDIKEVNLIEDTRAMAVSEINNNPAINLTNGEINALALDAHDDSLLAVEDVTVNLLNDKDGKLTLGLYDDDDTADDDATHDGGGFENLTLVTSDVEMNVTLADGTHLYNDDSLTSDRTNTDANGFGNDDEVDAGLAALKTAADTAQTAADNAQTTADTAQATADTAQTTATNSGLVADQTAADNAQATADTAQATADVSRAAANVAWADVDDAGQKHQTLPPLGGQDNLADVLHLEGSKDLTITGTDRQLDQAVIRTEMTDDAQSILALSVTANGNDVSLTDAEVDLIKVDASALTRHDLIVADDKGSRDKAMISVDDDTTVEINKIGDDGVLTITGDAERTDDLDIIINVNRNDANNGRLILGGDDLSTAETATAATAGGDSTEAGSSGNPATTQGVDANNVSLHVDITDSTLDQLDISALLGVVTIDGSKDLNIEDGGLIFDDTTVKFNNPNVFNGNTAGDLSVEGEGIGAGFGGDWIDATAMTGDLDIVLRDGTSNIILGAIINERVSPMSNADNGIRIDFGPGDDKITGLGTAVGPFAEEAGDNIDMGAGDDTVVIGVNDTTNNLVLNVPDVGSLQSGISQVFNLVEDDDDRTVSAAEDAAAGVYNTAVGVAGIVPLVATGSMSYDRINAEVFLGEGQDTVIFRNQNSGFLADNNGVRIKDFQAGNDGDIMGFQMFQDGLEDGMIGLGSTPMDNAIIQTDLNLFNNGQVIADTDTGIGGKYIINGADLNDNGLNDSATLFTPVASLLPVVPFDGDDNGANDGNVVLISTADIHAFTNSSASDLWASNAGLLMITDPLTTGVFKEVVNVSVTVTNDGHQYETIVLVGEATGDEGVKIFYVTDETAPDTAGTEHVLLDGAPTATLVGFLEGININDLDQDNFDFI